MEEKLRAFIAIELDPQIKRVIDSFENGLKLKGPSGLRWVKPDLLHLTLKFLGDITLTQSQAVSKVIDKIAVENSSFQLQLVGTGAFPNWRNPRTLWVGLGRNSLLEALFTQLDDALTPLGYTPEGKPFTAHLTLCRVSDTVDPRLVQPLQKEFESFSFAGLPVWNVTEVVLLKSQLQPGGPIYTLISKHNLK